MPPSQLYGWACVAHSVAEILSHAAEIRARQAATISVAKRTGRPDVTSTRPHTERHGLTITSTLIPERSQSNEKIEPGKHDVDALSDCGSVGNDSNIASSESSPLPESTRQKPLTQSSYHQADDAAAPLRSRSRSAEFEPPLKVNVSDSSPLVHGDSVPASDAQVIALPRPQKHLQASRVPSSRFGRLVHYGGLAASMGYGAATEAFRRVSSPENSTQSAMMSPANVSRLVEKLSRMRGAALKIGQFMSIQDTHLLPKDVEEVFRRVQDSAHYMPNWQMEKVMTDSLGKSWSSNFTSFEPIPFAAASLGQVHSAILAGHASPTERDEKVAVKIQFPDIARSIDSDLSYLKFLLNAGRMLPRGLFLDKTLQVMKGELADECDYRKEAASAKFFASDEGVGRDSRFKVPWIWDGSTERVLVMQNMEGVSVGGSVVDSLSQRSRDQIAQTIIELCMKELFEFRMMQTDPNWSNFLWNERTKQIELIDFGATRSYSREFIDKWMHLLQAAVAEDREECIKWSKELGYLTGEESETMLNAHVKSLVLTATPFRKRDDSGDDPRFSFGRDTEWAKVTSEIRSLIPIMLQERLTPPPQETYSLNRKLSGAFLLASRLGARVDCGSVWESAMRTYSARS